MVVDNLSVSDPTFGPSEADPVLLVDPDTVLPLSIPLQCLQMVAGGNSKVLDGVRIVEDEQLGSRPALQIRGADFPRSLGVFAVEHILGTLVAEGQDHTSMIARLVC